VAARRRDARPRPACAGPDPPKVHRDIQAAAYAALA